MLPLLTFVAKVGMDINSNRELQLRPQRATELTDLISGLGPAVIKAGQALASRSDLLPSEYLNELQKLQDRVPPFSDAHAYEILESQLGPLENVFRNLGSTPVAAASLGQVYRAELVDGRDVAVKVQRPGCEETIALDLHILRRFSGVLTRFLALLGREIDLVAVIDDFGTLIYDEIDYGVEAESAAMFSHLYGSIPNVSAPAIVPQLCTSRVLVMEWVQGFRLTDAESLATHRLQSANLVETLVQCSLRQILDTGFFHADPHLGNLLVTPSGQLTYIDFGMMSFLAPSQRYGIIEAVVHIVNRDFDTLARLYQRLGFIPSAQDPEPIAAALNDALPDALNASVSQLNFKSVIDKLGDVMYKYKFSLPPYYVAVIRCLLVLEGVSLQVDGDFAVVKDAYPYIASRLLTDNSPELQAALIALIFRDGRFRWDSFEALIDAAAGASEYDLVSVLEQLSSFLLSSQAVLLLENLTEELVNSLDELGADTAYYVYAYTYEVIRDITIVGGQAETANAAFSQFFSVVRVLVNGESLISAFERDVYAPPLPSSTRRALKLLSIVQRAASKGADASRISSLAVRLLSQRRVQRKLADFTLQLSERAIRRGLGIIFDFEETREFSGNVQSKSGGETENEMIDWGSEANEKSDLGHEKSDMSE